MTKTVLAFYKFLRLQNPQVEKERLVCFLEENLVVGTIILSNEGINGMCSLDNSKTEKVKKFLRKNFSLISLDIIFIVIKPFSNLLSKRDIKLASSKKTPKEEINS